MSKFFYFHFFLGLIFSSFHGYSQTFIDYPIKFSETRNASRLVEFQHSKFVKKITTQDGISYNIEKRYFKDDGINELVFTLSRLGHNVSVKNSKFTFLINDTLKNINFKIDKDSLLIVQPPINFHRFQLKILFNNEVQGIFDIRIVPKTKVSIIIVPLIEPKWSVDGLSKRLNQIYNNINGTISVKVQPIFKSKLISVKEKLDNPSETYDRYTKQMIQLRDEYFERYPNATKKAYYLFVTPEFTNQQIISYAPEKGMFCFANFKDTNHFYRDVSIELSRSILGTNLSSQFKKTNSDSILLTHAAYKNYLSTFNQFNYFDNYEDVRTNSGQIAYYFWEEDTKGNISILNNSFLSSIHRPYKKNYPSFYLNVSNPFFKEITIILNKRINILHIISLLSLIFGVYLVQKKIIIRFFLLQKIKKLTFIFLCAIALIVFIKLYPIINLGYKQFEIFNGKIDELKLLNVEHAVSNVGYNSNEFSNFEPKSYSENFIRKKQEWFKKRSKKVQWFEGVIDGSNRLVQLKHTKSSNTFRFNQKTIYASNHYMILKLKDSNNRVIKTKIYNHLGVDLSNKLTIKDPAKRVLLFTNGYRPTSLGGDFKSMLGDIENHGIEYPNSSNIIYPFDRFNYWHPWKKIDEKFAKRINASDIYFADGHFSVATSNHTSVVNFSTLSSMYPKRCPNPKQHSCFRTLSKNTFQNKYAFLFGKKSTSTYDLLATKSNKEGFKLRYDNGKIAGLNLLQQLNELPNNSKNDTLFIVAHSMGYAYSLGIIDVVRNKINFGGFYIIAPENAIAGSVNTKEWKQIWQYGSKYTNDHADPPCLQDGIAAQSKAQGLPVKNHVFIPHQLYTKKGFFDSHFVGNYKWIFEIPEGEQGYIKQN